MLFIQHNPLKFVLPHLLDCSARHGQTRSPLLRCAGGTTSALPEPPPSPSTTTPGRGPVRHVPGSPPGEYEVVRRYLHLQTQVRLYPFD